MDKPGCTVDGCKKNQRTRGWCGAHYQRWRRTGDPLGGGPDRVAPIWSAEETMRHHGWVVTSGGCWEWQGGINHNGYGLVTFRTVKYLAHRFAYTLWAGPIPADTLLRHSCDNPPCINPEHLSPGTHQSNTYDAISRRRFANGTRAGGAKLSDEQVEAIRTRYAAGETSKALGLEYGVHRDHVGDAC